MPIHLKPDPLNRAVNAQHFTPLEQLLPVCRNHQAQRSLANNGFVVLHPCVAVVGSDACGLRYLLFK